MSRHTGAAVAPAPPPARAAHPTVARRAAPGLLLAVVVLLATLFATVVQVAVPRAAGAAPQDGEVTLDLLGSSPAVARPGDAVAFSVEVTNGTDTAVAGDLDLGVSWRPLTSRDRLASWADESGTTTAALQLSEPVDRIAPGESARVRLELDVDALGLPADSPWGPRELSVAFVRDGTPLDVLHSFLLYAPDGADPAPVSVSVVAPVTGPAVDPLDPGGYDAQLAELTGTDGRLTRLLDAATATAGSPGLSLAVDPALAAAAAGSEDAGAQAWAARLTGQAPSADTATGTEPTDGGTATDGTAADTAPDTGAAPVADVAVLPGFDPDLAALAHADPTRSEVAAATGGEAALGSTWQRPDGWDLTLAWPQGRPDDATLAAGKEAGVDQVLVTDGLAPRDEAPASARTAVETSSGKVPALVADAGLSDAVADLADDGAAPTSAEASQRLLADTALLAMQQQAGGEELHVVAALPRSWSPDAGLVSQVLATLDKSAWTDVAPLGEAVAAPASRVERQDVARDTTDDAELQPAAVRRLLDAHRDVTAFSSVAADPVELSGDVDQGLVAPLAVAARTEPAVRTRAVDLAVDQAQALQGGITVADRSDVTLVSDTGKLPVTVTNELPVDATVTVELRPDDPRLVVESLPTVVVPASTATNVLVPVRAIGSGDVNLQVEVLAPSGVVVSGPTSFAVAVRAGWETAGTAVVAAAVGLLFVGGIWRTVRRGRSSARTTDDGVGEAVDPLPPDDTSDGTPRSAPSDDDRPNTPAKATETDPT